MSEEIKPKPKRINKKKNIVEDNTPEIPEIPETPETIETVEDPEILRKKEIADKRRKSLEIARSKIKSKSIIKQENDDELAKIRKEKEDEINKIKQENERLKKIAEEKEKSSESVIKKKKKKPPIYQPVEPVIPVAPVIPKQIQEPTIQYLQDKTYQEQLNNKYNEMVRRNTMLYTFGGF